MYMYYDVICDHNCHWWNFLFIGSISLYPIQRFSRRSCSDRNMLLLGWCHYRRYLTVDPTILMTDMEYPFHRWIFSHKVSIRDNSKQETAVNYLCLKVAYHQTFPFIPDWKMDNAMRQKLFTSPEHLRNPGVLVGSGFYSLCLFLDLYVHFISCSILYMFCRHVPWCLALIFTFT